MRTVLSLCYISLEEIKRVKPELLSIQHVGFQCQKQSSPKSMATQLLSSYLLQQKYNSKTCELESTFGFISYAISSGNTLGSWEGIPEWEMMLFQFAGFLDGWFLTCNSAPLHVTSLPSSLSFISSFCIWKSDIGREKAPGEIKTANQICKVFHILLMSRHHELQQ